MQLPLAAIHPFWLLVLIAVPGLLAYRIHHNGRESVKNWWVAVGGIITLVAAVFAFGIVEIPKLEDLPLKRYIADIGGALGDWTYPLVGLLAFLETGAFVGLAAPGETFVMFSGVLAGEGTLNLFVLIPIVWICAFTGDVVSFYLGRRLGRTFLETHGPRFKITSERLEQTDAFFQKHGGKAILIGRFIGFVRAIAPFILGSSGVKVTRMLPYSFVGSGLWASLFCTLGFVFWESLDKLLSAAKEGSLVFGSIVALLVFLIFGIPWLRKKENREQLRDWLKSALRGNSKA